MLVTHKKYKLVNSIDQYFIIDNKIEDYIDDINSQSAESYKNIKYYIRRYKLDKILLVLNIKTFQINDRLQTYYRIFNGRDVFWAEMEEFEKV